MGLISLRRDQALCFNGGFARGSDQEPLTAEVAENCREDRRENHYATTIFS
jgi:hypothetical protein